jgi:hypothetical protein
MNSFLNDYLIKCDSIYKYNLENIKQLPEIKKIRVSLKISEKSREFEGRNILSLNLINIQLFLIIYVFYFSYPFIKYSKSKTSKENFFVLNSIILKKSLIYSFLDSFFVDNSSKIKNLNFLSLNHFKKNLYFLKTNTILTIEVPLTFFDEINEIATFTNFNVKELLIVLSFSIKNPIFLKLKSHKFFLENLPYFWHFN